MKTLTCYICYASIRVSRSESNYDQIVFQKFCNKIIHIGVGVYSLHKAPSISQSYSLGLLEQSNFLCFISYDCIQYQTKLSDFRTPSFIIMKYHSAYFRELDKISIANDIKVSCQ